MPLPITKLLHAALTATLTALTLAACSPAASLNYPLQVRAEAERDTDGAQQLPRWCEDGFCSVGPRVVLDERNVRSVMVQPGESRFGLLLELNESGRVRLKSFAQGNTGDQRLTVIVDGKALKALTARHALKTGKIKLTGPREDILRLREKLTNSHNVVPK